MENSLAIFRCDANKKIGNGHVYRCISIAESLANYNCEILFIIKNNTFKSVSKLSQFECIILNEDSTFDDEIKLLQENKKKCKKIFIIDNYELDYEYQKLIKENLNVEVMVVDDVVNDNYFCDYLINFTLSDSAKYSHTKNDNKPELFIGPEYAPLGRRFNIPRISIFNARKNLSKVRNVFIFISTVDKYNVTTKVLEVISELKLDLKIDVVIGSYFISRPELDSVIKKSNESINLHIDTENIEELMRKADIGFVGGGGVLREALFMGLPSIVFKTSPHQTDLINTVSLFLLRVYNGEKIDKKNISVEIKRSIDDVEKLKLIGMRSMSFINGFDFNCVASKILTESAGVSDEIYIKKVRKNDMLLLWEWQSYPGIRKYFRNQHVPDLDEHEAWFKSYIDKVGSYFVFIMLYDKPVGYIRVDELNNDNDHEVSILIIPEYQNKGIGSAALKIIRNCFPVSRLCAFIKDENNTSKNLFVNNQYYVDKDYYVSDPIIDINKLN